MKYLILLIFLTATSCRINDDSNLYKENLPESWSNNIDVSQKKELEKTSDWWKVFNDHQLDSLIDRAIKVNSDMQIALINIDKATSYLSLTNKSFLPNISAEANAGRTSPSKQIPSLTGYNAYDVYNIDANLSYQIDLWGKLAKSSKLARSQLLAAQSTKDNVMLTIISDVTKTYFNILSLHDQVHLTKTQIELSKEIYNLKKIHFEVGNINKTDLMMIESNLFSLEASLPPILQQLSEQEYALKILLGKNPKDYVQEDLIDKKSLDNVEAKIILPKTLPAELMTARPDIKIAEENLKSANIQVALARSAFLPDISLTSLIGVSSINLDTLFKNSNTWQIGGGLTAPLFDFGRTGINIKIAKSEKELAVIEYQKTIRQAFAEVYTALSAQENTKTAFDRANDIEKNAKEMVDISNLKVSTGYSNNFELLAAKQNLANTELMRIKSKQARLNSMVDLFKALGGEWYNK